MTERSHKVLEQFQIRKSKQQKEAFRSWLCGELEAMGYSPKVEKGSFARNVVVGDPDSARVVYTAHYDTCPVLPIPNFITPRNIFWYLLYQFAIVLPMFVIALAAEVGIMVFWEVALGVTCPLPVALAAMYAVLLFFIWWIYDGPANKHTVNDNTSGVLTLLEIAEALPQELRGDVALIFFDNEEKGLLGSSACVKQHRAAKKNALVLNFDCVSDGDYIQLFPAKPLKKKEKNLLDAMEQSFLSTPGKTVEVVRDFGFYPSDQRRFRRGVGICALKKKPIVGYYMDRIHTKKDTVLMEENIQLLRDGAIRLAEKLSEKETTAG